jgi:hypothetical protein
VLPRRGAEPQPNGGLSLTAFPGVDMLASECEVRVYVRERDHRENEPVGRHDSRRGGGERVLPQGANYRAGLAPGTIAMPEIPPCCLLAAAA